MTRHPFEALERLAGGLGTALLAACALLAWLGVGVACLTGVGLLLAPKARALTRAVAERERARLSGLGTPVVTPYLSAPAGRVTRPDGKGALSADPADRRDIGWLACHGTLGVAIGLLGVLPPLGAVRDITFPLWWELLPVGERGSALGIPIYTWPGALAVSLMGVGWVLITVVAGPPLARHRSAGPSSGSDAPRPRPARRRRRAT
ncbi:sensor domain-containing protein [Nonomuraea sp. NPDC005983]|uniref:sensor domain-containing protein n=1 Tax=Nonomuraea sp. NPDC005983 TaxID=3155595 RepID=UPI0033BC613A